MVTGSARSAISSQSSDAELTALPPQVEEPPPAEPVRKGDRHDVVRPVGREEVRQLRPGPHRAIRDSRWAGGPAASAGVPERHRVGETVQARHLGERCGAYRRVRVGQQPGERVEGNGTAKLFHDVATQGSVVVDVEQRPAHPRQEGVTGHPSIVGRLADRNPKNLGCPRDPCPRTMKS